MYRILAVVLLACCCSFTNLQEASAGVVSFKSDQLFVDGQPQPQLFGAEVQYFRLRGGQGKNIPREKVLKLWNAALDRLVETHANAISFYIPWDFHEYAPGKFDFDGTVDEDGDGLPDYPSRDLKTWFKLIEAHGIKHILVRPGPYINAEWGFLGFGAVPLWFHEKYPNSHMQNTKGQKVALYGYGDADFLRESSNWLETVYKQVLVHYIGAGKPIDFLQIDNETNFQWSSIYSKDYSPRAVAAYRKSLQRVYGTIAKLNAKHGRAWKSFDEVRPPMAPDSRVGDPDATLAENQDWYRFQDSQIHSYLHEIRKVWENLGVREPEVLFTLAESYNASDNQLLPNYKLRNDPGKTGFMTVNLYPKTADGETNPLFNQPFKADHDVKADTSANAYYLGHSGEWSMGPEIQGGWWRGTTVSTEARQQTYLTTIGHGLKALFVYYFNEGDNWDYDWAKKQVAPYFIRLKQDPRFKDVTYAELPSAFWTELNNTFANQVLAGWDAKSLLEAEGTQNKSLYFDAPIDGNAQPRGEEFQVLKRIGEKVVNAHGDFLGSAIEMTDEVCFIKDHRTNVESPIKGLDSLQVNSDWAGSLVAYLLQEGINPRILHWGLTPNGEYDSCKVFVYQDNGFATPEFTAAMKGYVTKGATVVGFLNDGLFTGLAGLDKNGPACTKVVNATVDFDATKCTPTTHGAGYLYQVRNPVYKDYNSELYATINDVPQRATVLRDVLKEAKLTPQIRIVGGGDRVVAFARQNRDQSKVWVTVKSGQTKAFVGKIAWSTAKLGATYTLTDIFGGQVSTVTGQDLRDKGINVSLIANGSDAFFLELVANR